MELTEEGKHVLWFGFDDMNGLRACFLDLIECKKISEDDIVTALNEVGNSEFDVPDMVELFFKGMGYAKMKFKRNLMNKVWEVWESHELSDEGRDVFRRFVERFV